MRRILIPVAALLGIATAGTALLMSRGGDNPDNLMQAALSTTCDPVLTRYCDAVVDEAGNIWHYRYDGEDYHGVHTLTDGSTVEEIQKGPNFCYIANPGDDWSTFRYESSFIGICGPAAEAAATRSVVVDPEDFDQGGLNYRYLGDSTLDGQAVKHYISAGLSAELTESLTESEERSAETPPDDSSDDITTVYADLRITEEYWASTSSNHILQIRRTVSDIIDGERVSEVILIRFSGFGEPNVITAPIDAPPPPDPTATPTPTPTPEPGIPTPTPTPTPASLNGNPRAESVTQTSVTVSWDRLRPTGEYLRDTRANFRQSAS